MEQNWRAGLAQDSRNEIVNRMNMLYLETETQNASNGALPTSSNGTNPARPLDSVAPGDSLQQVGQPGGMDQADIVWRKMQTLKEKYLQDMKDLYNMLTNRSQQHMSEDQLQKLTHYTGVIQRMMPYLIAAEGSLPEEFKEDKVEAFEKQIVSIMETFKRQKQVVPQQQQPQQQGNLGQVQAVQLMDM